jgi:hypothetical protein
MTEDKGILRNHSVESWRFYVYGEDDEGEPLFSFWMNTGPNTGVCIYERNQGAGKWLSTVHDDEEYTGKPPSDLLKEVIRGAIGQDTRGVPAERMHDLPDHERYFFQVIHGTIEQKGKAPDELLRFIEHVVGNEVRIAP